MKEGERHPAAWGEETDFDGCWIFMKRQHIILKPCTFTLGPDSLNSRDMNKHEQTPVTALQATGCMYTSRGDLAWTEISADYQEGAGDLLMDWGSDLHMQYVIFVMGWYGMCEYVNWSVLYHR